MGTLRLRLQLTGDLATEAQGHPQSGYDDDIHQAVRRFQERHGMPAKGVVDEHTRALLNIPVEDRIRQILANLERARWLPDDLGDPYVLVNLANFALQVVEGGRDVIQMRVVIGEPETISPVFSDKISYIEVNPYWNVPRSIAVKEMLRVLRRNPGALTAQNIRLFARRRGDQSGERQLVGGQRQQLQLPPAPGSRGAKRARPYQVHVPDPYGVYLHDTFAGIIPAAGPRVLARMH